MRPGRSDSLGVPSSTHPGSLSVVFISDSRPSLQCMGILSMLGCHVVPTAANLACESQLDAHEPAFVLIFPAVCGKTKVKLSRYHKPVGVGGIDALLHLPRFPSKSCMAAAALGERRSATEKKRRPLPRLLRNSSSCWAREFSAASTILLSQKLAHRRCRAQYGLPVATRLA